MHSAHRGFPDQNEDNYYRISTKESNAEGWVLSIERPIEIEREGRNETIMLDKVSNMIYAYKEGSFSRHARTNRGFFTMRVNSRSQTVDFNSKVGANDVFYKVHGIIFYINWSIMTFVILVSGRYMRHLYNFRMIVHASTGVLLTSNTVILVLLSLFKYKVTGGDYVAHKPIGITVMIVSVLQCFGGMSLKSMSTSLEWNSKFNQISKLGHQIFGFCLILLSNFQVTTGLYRYHSPVKSLIFVHFAVFILMVVILEIVHRLYFKYKEKGVIRKDGINVYKIDDFKDMLSQGRKLALFNDNILDVEKFIDEHPGTSFVIKQ